jgi:hypothetical protein
MITRHWESELPKQGRLDMQIIRNSPDLILDFLLSASFQIRNDCHQMFMKFFDPEAINQSYRQEALNCFRKWDAHFTSIVLHSINKGYIPSGNSETLCFLSLYPFGRF